MQKSKKVFFKSKEEAEYQTGYFSVNSLMITTDLYSKIISYINTNNLSTFIRANKERTSMNTYTLTFTVKNYFDREKPIAYLSKPGAEGYYKNTYTDKFDDLLKRTPTLEDMYFWIVRKYPSDLLWMDYSIEKPRVPPQRESK